MSMPPKAGSDQELWRAALDGSADVWGELLPATTGPSTTSASRRTGGWSVAEELTSAVFLHGGRRLASVQPALARVALPPEEADHADDVAARLDAQRRVAWLRERLNTLPRRDREVLELAATGELSHADIAIALGIAVGTVKSRLARARRRLGGLEGPDAAAQPSTHAPTGTHTPTGR